LFTIIYDDDELPIDEIWACLTNTNTKPNLSTVQRSATEPDSLYELEKGTQDVVSAIMQQIQGGGGNVKIPGVDQVLPTVDTVNLAGLGSPCRWRYIGSTTEIETNICTISTEPSSR
jgi:hypothetical protein